MNKTVEELEVVKEVHTKSGGFPIVGIGSSAGGLEALADFFRALPDSVNMAFIVQHVWPKADINFGDIVQRYTHLKVIKAEQGMPIEPGRAYVVPPYQNITLKGKELRLSPKPDHAYIAHSIDLLFRSMARELADNAIGIVLSGTGSDGAFGSKLINHRLGMVMAQDPATAKYRNMPDSVIKLGVADYVLAPERMPERLIAYVQSYFGKPAIERENEFEQESYRLNTIFELAWRTTKFDLSIYKLSTVLRRINRRMSIVQAQTIEEYAKYLKNNSTELEYLVKEFLTNVTNFFQEPGAFDAMKDLLKTLLRRKHRKSTVSAWVLGCATGEDTYSFAILLQECIEEIRRGLTFKLFATDIDETAINIARNGIYPASILEEDITADRLEKYFIKQNSEYRVKPEIRRNVFFSIQDFLRPPSFQGLDFISSRVIMLYLSPGSQNKLIPILYSRLNSRGLLFTGTEDSVGQFPSLFHLVDSQWKIYERAYFTVNGRMLKELKEKEMH